MEVEVVSELNIAGEPARVLNYVPELSTGDLAQDPQLRELAGQLSRWVDNARGAIGRTSMFDRGAYTPPDNPYDEMRAARHAVKFDSVVSGVHELTEAYAFQGCKWESDNADESDVFNQLARDMNLDVVLRKMWREEYTSGQFICAKLWGWVDYSVRGYMPPEELPLESFIDPMTGIEQMREPLDPDTGRPKKKPTKGQKRKKKYRFWAPVGMRIIDSCKVVPVGGGPLGGEQLAWQATPGEIGYYSQSLAGETIDPLMMTFFQGKYTPNFEEAGELGQLGVDIGNLLLMNPGWVFRHTLTKPDYQRFPDIRLKSCFQLLDLKRALMASDRAMLIGAANYILLIRKGLPDEPATAPEMEHLKANYNFIAKMPVIISDHRLEIDIIAPKTDMTLDEKKYDTLNTQILGRLLGTLQGTSAAAGRNDTQQTLSLSLARVMENRRHMMRRTMEKEIARAVVNHPKNKGVFESEPSLVFTPRNIALAMDSGYTQGLLGLRQQREISRETILEFFGLDEATEAMRMELEELYYDDIFQTEIPYAATGNPSWNVDQNLVTPDGQQHSAPPPAGAPGAGSGKTPPGQTKDGAGKNPAKSTPASGQPNSGRARKGPNGTAEAPGVSGARGGRPKGGGRTAGSPQKTAKPRTSSGNVSTRKK